MKVYVLMEYTDCDPSVVAGVYSSRENAIATFPFHEREFTEEEIQEFEVDATLENTEAYEQFWYFCVYQVPVNGQMSHCGQSRMKPSDVPEPEAYFKHDFSRAGNPLVLMCIAYSKTKDEASAKATEGLRKRIEEEALKK